MNVAGGRDRARAAAPRAARRAGRRDVTGGPRLPRPEPGVADPGGRHYRAAHVRRPPTSGEPVTVGATTSGDPSVAWDAFVAGHPLATYLQTAAWARVKAANGWSSRLVEAEPADGGRIGARILLRRPAGRAVDVRLRPARSARGAVDRNAPWPPGARRSGRRSPATGGPAGVAHVRIDPEIELDGPLDAGGAARATLERLGWRPAPEVQPSVTRVVDLTADEAALWSDLRSKWRQYVNRCPGRRGDRRGRRRRRGSDRLPGLPPDHDRDVHPDPDADPDRGRLSRHLGRVPARRAGPGSCSPGMPPGTSARCCSLVRCGARVVEPYGGMTGGRRRAPGELPAQVGGDPVEPRAGRDVVRHVGPRPSRHPPVQGGLRRTRGPPHRCLGPALEHPRLAVVPPRGGSPAATARADGRGVGHVKPKAPAPGVAGPAADLPGAAAGEALAALVAAAEPTGTGPLGELVDRLATEGRLRAVVRDGSADRSGLARRRRGRAASPTTRASSDPATSSWRSQASTPTGTTTPRRRSGRGAGGPDRRATARRRRRDPARRRAERRRARRGRGLVVRRSEPRAGGRRGHRDRRQDDDVVPRRRGARGGRASRAASSARSRRGSARSAPARPTT